MPGTVDIRLQPKPICAACQREVDYVRGSMWHGEDKICRECFIEWYDGHGSTNPVEIGNYVREKHGLPALSMQTGNKS